MSIESEETVDSVETQKCLDALDYLMRYKGESHAIHLVQRMRQRLVDLGVIAPPQTNTPYINTISRENEPEYPGDLNVESELSAYIRWNAMAMVVQANRVHDGLGGHISTYASSATLYDVGFNHIFRGNNGGYGADQVYIQGHASPGIYARAYMEGRLAADKLHAFRQELTPTGGLSSYPHPYLMPSFWQFPTVSMGLGPVMSIYQARFNRYLINRGFLSAENEPRVYCFIGDGESDEPETLGALSLGSRENLDNLCFVVNCNLQRLDGPVRGNGKIIQELESVFNGAGWNVIKVIWGGSWDGMLESDQRELLIKRMNEAVDGEYQKYTVEKGSYIRKHFFSKYPELKSVVNHLTDKQIKKLVRGGHDPKKVYAAYRAAMETKGKPSVILAKTVKGYGLGEAGEGRNISHQQKKMNERELREFRDRLNVPISDEEIANAPFFRPAPKSAHTKYLLERRKELGGFLPERKETDETLPIPPLSEFKEFLTDSGDHEFSTTMAFVRMLTKLLGNKELGKKIVPIVPDECRTFGMEALFRQIGIYAAKGQLYEPADSESFLYYKEAKDGQMLEEGINEVGAMCSFLSAGTCYSTHGFNMIPFFIYYSMFGFQRIGDLIWLSGDIRAKGFMLGATAGRTTLNGEGLQHQDGHSHLLASTIPSVRAYDPTFRYEIAVIVQDGMRRLYQEGETAVYYLTVGNENYHMPAMPKGVEEGIIKGLYKFSQSTKKKGHQVHLIGSGAILNEVIRAKEILESDFGCRVDVWSATSYNQLRREAIDVQRQNMLNPGKKAKQSYVESVLGKEKGVFVAASDNMKIVSDQIAPWVPGGLFSLGTDGFGRSDTRENLRRFFEVDAECIAVGALYWLSQNGEIKPAQVEKAIKALKVDPKKVSPHIGSY